jgi:hypothetical protein
VLCAGTADALPRGKRLPRWRARIDIVFGPPFTLEAPGDPRARSTIAAAAEEIRAALVDHIRRHDSRGEHDRGRTAGAA